MKERRNKMLPPTSPTRFRSDSALLADELSKAAEMIYWPRMPELKEYEAVADQMIIAGHCGLEGLMDISSSERPQLYGTLAERKPGWARRWREMPDAKAPPMETGQKKAAPSKEFDIFATSKAKKALAGNGEILRQRQEAVNLFCEASYEGAKSFPPPL